MFTAILSEETENATQSSEISESESESDSYSHRDAEWDDENLSKSIILSFYEYL